MIFFGRKTESYDLVPAIFEFSIPKKNPDANFYASIQKCTPNSHIRPTNDCTQRDAVPKSVSLIITKLRQNKGKGGNSWGSRCIELLPNVLEFSNL